MNFKSIPYKYNFKNSGIEKPILGLAALNPHCGEEGKCGREEIDAIAQQLKKLKKWALMLEDHIPDILIKAFNGDYGVVTMYHDQVK